MHRLGNLNAGPIKTTSYEQYQALNQPAVTLQPIVQPIVIDPLVEELRATPELKPYIQPDLIPDLISMLYWDGLQDYLNEKWPIELPPADVDDIQPSAPPEGVDGKKLRAQVNKVFHLNGVEAAAARLEINLTELQRRGLPKLIAEAQRANPADPGSIVFNHNSQDRHRATQQIEREIIMNEPDVVESSVLSCPVCRGNKISTTIVQRRALDEPATLVSACARCRHRWTMSMA